MKKNDLKISYEKQDIVIINDLIDAFEVGTIKREESIYKYLDMDTFITCLGMSTLRFSEPTVWKDKFEKRFYLAKYENAKSTDTPMVFANCFTKSEMSEAAWKIYSYDKNGLAKRCIKLTINHQLLFDALIKYANKNCYELYEGNITYLPQNTIMKIHHKDNIIGKKLFSSFDLSSYINLLLIKRDFFRHENEIRFFLIDKKRTKKDKGKTQKGSINGKYIDINLSWKDIIEEIQISKDCTSNELMLFSNVCSNKGIDTKKIQSVDLYKAPKNPHININKFL